MLGGYSQGRGLILKSSEFAYGRWRYVLRGCPWRTVRDGVVFVKDEVDTRREELALEERVSPDEFVAAHVCWTSSAQKIAHYSLSDQNNAEPWARVTLPPPLPPYICFSTPTATKYFSTPTRLTTTQATTMATMCMARTKMMTRRSPLTSRIDQNSNNGKDGWMEDDMVIRGSQPIALLVNTMGDRTHHQRRR